MTVCWKPTHSGRYLKGLQTLHQVTAKCSTVGALLSRSEAIVTNKEQRQAEFSKIGQELLANDHDYPPRFIDNRLTDGRWRSLCDLEMLRPRTNGDRQQCSYHLLMEKPAPAENLEASEYKSKLESQETGSGRSSSSWKIGPVEMMTQVLYIVSSVATVNNHTLEKRDAQPAYHSRLQLRWFRVPVFQYTLGWSKTPTDHLEVYRGPVARKLS